MNTQVLENKDELGRHSARVGAEHIRSALASQDRVQIILATGASQFEMLSNLVNEPEIDWSRVTMFHLDEYIGVSDQHPASFRKYLQERFVAKVPTLGQAHFVLGDAADPEAECRRLNGIIAKVQIDVAMVGIGENGHLAFNDPPADFQTDRPFLIVDLDEDCRRQQMGEGWFESLEDVPRHAISMSIKEIMRCSALVVTVPDARKAQAVFAAATGPVTPDVPASILQNHPNCLLALDQESASLLPQS